MFDADDSLSRLVSLLWDLSLRTSGLHYDIDLCHAPSECHELLDRGFGRAVHDAIVAAGYVDAQHLERAICNSRGVPAKWLFARGGLLGSALAAAGECELSRRTTK